MVQLLSAKWVVPGEGEGRVLEDHTVVVQDDKIVVLSLLLLALRCGFYLVLFGLAQVRGFQLQGGMNSAG